MKRIKVIVVRICLTESEHMTQTIIDYLKEEIKIRGITVFRAISGYGKTGNHPASWVDLSLDLPITIEFFDHENKINSALEHLAHMIKPEHIVFWEAYANDKGEV